jgi:hypothetical protein
MIKRVAPDKPFSPIVPKSGIQGDGPPDAGSQEALIDRKKREKDEDAPGVKVRLSKKHRGGAGNTRDADTDGKTERQGRKKIDIMA